MSIRWTKGGIASPAGFLASGIHAGIKKTKKEDLTLIYTEAPARAAAVFTKNQLVAWPVIWSREAAKFPYHHAILASSGNANCFNGPTGKAAVEVSLRTLSKILDVPEESILMAQTGVIGRPYPVETIRKAIAEVYAKLNPKGQGAARGIMTTDTRPKEYSLEFKFQGRKITIGSIAKGCGMVHPNMATMFVFITTDLNIEKKLLEKLLKRATNETLNRMSVDNDQSTNDCAFILANGLAGNRTVKTEKDAKVFYAALLEILRKQRFEIVRDGEGVRHVCEIVIERAKTQAEGEKIARQIANSMLFKTMLTGADPNWGRVAAAVGSAGIPVDFQKIEISFNGVASLKAGVPLTKNLGKIRKILERPHFKLKVDLKRGKEKVDFVTSDLTKEYVQINSEYST